MTSEMDDLAAFVQKNCDVSDARHAGDATMCIYLLRMREHYKWVSGAPPGASIDHKTLGAWIASREDYLASLQEADYESVRIDSDAFDPFDRAGINRRIGGRQLVYCAGYGRRGKPVFCLGELAGREATDDYEVFTIGTEYAREMSAPVAMSQQNMIYVRQDAMLRWVWELYEEWSWRKPRNSFFKAVSHFGRPDDIPRVLESLAEKELENLILHEIGEIAAGDLLGQRWKDMLLALTNTPVEFPARSVRDNLADTITLLPKLMHEGDAASIHFYFCGSHPVRDQLFPMLKNAYRRWDETSVMGPLRAAVKLGRTHWLETAHELMEIFDRYGVENLSRFQSTVERRAL
jgi:hypothetical protein